MNKLLERQVKKYLGGDPAIPDNFQALLKAISDSYDHNERDRRLLERSIEISSMEMKEMNSKLKREVEEGNREVFQQLKESLHALNDDEEQSITRGLDYRKLSQIAEILKNETHKRRAAEREKVQRATHLEASQKIAHIGSWEFDLTNVEDIDSNGLYWSDETYRIFGFEPQSVEINTGLFYKCIPADEAGGIQEAVQRAIETGGSFELEHRIVLGNGTEKTVRERAEIVTDPHNPDQRKMIGTVQDITERKQVAEEIKRMNYELKTLFANMQECVFTVDTTVYKLIQISPSCEDIYGYSVEEFMNDPELWINVVLEEDRAVVWAKQPNLERGESIINTYRIKDKQGNIKWLESKLKPTLNEAGKLVRLDGVTSDITQRKQAEIALKNSEYRFRSLIENSADAILIVNERSENIYASDSFYRIMGYSQEEAHGVSSFRFFHPDEIPMMREHVEKVLNNPGKTFSIEYRRQKKDGSYIWCEGSATNLLHVPAVNGIVINFRDITERKQSERALQASNQELRKSNNELDRFVYSVSHDLRAPLSSMLGVISLIECEITDPDIVADVELLKSSIHKLDGFIADILDYSRNSRTEIEPRKIDFAEKLKDIKNNLKYMPSAGSPVTINTNISGDKEFYSDETRCGVILNNLVSNAIRYRNPEIKDPLVEINIQVCGMEAKISVRDNGIGIAGEKQDRVFDMFYRVSQKSAGSGLGLYIVKETIEKLRGSIGLKSEPGKGSCFTVTLPNLINSHFKK